MLIALLRQLPPSGWAGLEGLIALLLGEQLGLQARLENTGPQGGRDIGLFDRSSGMRKNIDVEVKRYSNGARPSRRMLLGELAETKRDRPSTELWILVCTRALPAKLVSELQDQGFSDGFDVVVLDHAQGNLSLLEVLVASHPSVVIRWLTEHDPPTRVAWPQVLNDVRAHPAYAVRQQELAAQLSGRFGTFAAAAKAREWLLRLVQGSRRRREGLNQGLGRKDRAPHVPRPRLEQAVEDWLAQRDPGGRLLALLGSEGDGKTWCAVNLLLADARFVPLIATSNMFDDGGAESLLAQALERQCGGDMDRWRDRLTRRDDWPADFRILILIDGLNEAPHRRTDELIAELLEEKWVSSLDVIVTCRTPYWQHRLLPYLGRSNRRIKEIHVGPFDLASEWPIARAHLAPDNQPLPSAVDDALRNPRLWSFAFDLRDRLGGLSELTLEGLLVEHWRMRLSDRKDLKISSAQFDRLIAHSVDSLRTGSSRGAYMIDTGTLDRLLRDMVGSGGDYSADLAEIRDGVFYATSADERLRLRPERVPVALGLLLVEQVLGVPEGRAFEREVRAAAAAFLDDLPASDRIELIVRTAVFSLLAMPGASGHGLATLLRYWVALQNKEADFERALAIAAAAAPGDFIAAIEDEMRGDELVAEGAASELGAALLSRRDLPQVRHELRDAVGRWFRSIPLEIFQDIGHDNAQGLLGSEIPFVLMLDDIAASFLSHLPLADWSAPLSAWSVRRVALASVTEANQYRPDHEVGWLGWCGQLDDAQVQKLLEGIQRQHGDVDDRVMSTARALLQGEVLLAARVAQELNHEPWAEATADAERFLLRQGGGQSSDDGLTFETLYRDESPDSTERWLQVERVMLDRAQERLVELVDDLLTQAQRAIERSEIGGFAQFARDHALLLGSDVIPLIRRYVEAAGSASEDRAGVHFSGRALAPLFLVTEPSAHGELVASLRLSAQIGKLDLTGLSPSGDALLESRLVAEAAAGNAASLRAYLHLAAHWCERPLGAPARSLLLAHALGADPALAVLASTALVNAGDAKGTERIMLDAAAPRRFAPLPVGQTLSAWWLRAIPNRSYAEARSVLALTALVDAAIADGTDVAVELFSNDFDAILQSMGVADWPSGSPSADFAALAGAGARDSRRGVKRSSIGKVMLPVGAARRALEFFQDRQPTYVAGLCQRLEMASGEVLAALEGAGAVVSAAATFMEDAVAGRVMRRLGVVDRGSIDHHGLRVTSVQRFCFSDDRPAARELRNDLLDQAWNDEALLIIVCLSELEGRQHWLETRILEEAQRPQRANRARALLLRGWRAEADDRIALESMQANTGYLRHVGEIALHRVLRRENMRRLLAEFTAADTDMLAWLAYRRLIPFVDRRVILETLDHSPWASGLTRRRRLHHELAKADYERLFRRTEGDLPRMFAGMAVPALIPPWQVAPFYQVRSDHLD